MKVVIFGGRNLPFDEAHRAMLEEYTKASGWEDDISEVVSGACGVDADDRNPDAKPCKGGDYLGESYAAYWSIPLRRFYAAWKREGRGAGPRRNQRMALYADAGIGLPGDRGTIDMIKRLRACGKPVYAPWADRVADAKD